MLVICERDGESKIALVYSCQEKILKEITEKLGNVLRLELSTEFGTSETNNVVMYESTISKSSTAHIDRIDRIGFQSRMKIGEVEIHTKGCKVLKKCSVCPKKEIGECQ